MKNKNFKLKQLKKPEAKTRLKKLRHLIYKHDHFYYNLDQPKIDDYEYDQLFSELVNLETKYPDLITPDSPSQRVPGKALLYFEKGVHRKAMLSLQNTYNENEIIDFYEKTLKLLKSNKIEFLLEPKLDGVAINLIYEKGFLTQALTRGDGNTGENVLENIKTIHSIPLNLPISIETLEVRGEVVLLKEDFKKINKQKNEQGLSPFANPRNMAAGSLRQLDPVVTAHRPLKFFAHSPGFFKGIKLQSQSDFFKTIKKAGLPALPIVGFKSFQNKKNTFAAAVLCKNKNEILKYFHLMEKRRHRLRFETDGIVIKVNSFSEQEKMGSISRSPRWAKAAKFEPERAETLVENISIQIGRTGVLTPVAQLKPVSVGGVTITHATLHNQSEIAKKDIRKGDTVIVGRAGDVIPEIVKVHFSKRKNPSSIFKMPNSCPVCSATVEEVRDIVFCTNSLCPAIALQSLIHFASKKAMNIESLGSKIMNRLYKKKLVKNFSDIYSLTKEKLLSLEGMGEKSSERILKSIEKSKKTKLHTFIFALGIRHIGEQTAYSLSNFFIKKPKRISQRTQRLSANAVDTKQLSFPQDIYQLHLEENTTSPKKKKKESFSPFSKLTVLNLIAKATEEELKEIPDIGEVVASSIRESFSRQSFIQEIQLLLKLGIQIEIPKPKETQQVFSGKKIAITGSLPQSRSQVEKLILSLGGKVQNTVNQKADFLLTNSDKEEEHPSQKIKQARKFNIPILSWKTFQKKIKA